MAQAPTWLAAQAGSPLQSGQANQFFGGHSATMAFQTNRFAGGGLASGSTVATATQYVARSFTTGSTQTTFGYLICYLAATAGSGQPPQVVGIYPDSGANTPLLSTTVNGVSSSTVIQQVNITQEYASQGITQLIIPLPVTTLQPNTKYWVVFSPTGSGGSNFVIHQQVFTSSGAFTSSNGVTWTAQSFNIFCQFFDLNPVVTQNFGTALLYVWEDGGNKYEIFYRPGNGYVSTPVNNFVYATYQYVAGQGGNIGYTQSIRNTVSTTSGQLTSVS